MRVKRYFKSIALVMLAFFLLSVVLPASVFAGDVVVVKKQRSQETQATVVNQVYGQNVEQGKQEQKQEQKQEEELFGDANKGLPVLRTEPADGAKVVRPDVPIKIFFDESSKWFCHVKEQLEKGHFQVTINGQKTEAVFDGKNVIEVKHGLLSRYTRHTVKFVLHVEDNGNHNGFGNGNGNEWMNKTYEFSFETGSALNEPRHAKFGVSHSNPRVTEGTELEVAFTDDYGQPGYGAKGKVNLIEYGARKPGSAVAEPAEFAVPEGSDGKVKVRISNTEAEKVGVVVEVSGPYPEDAARFDGEVNFRPGPAAKVSLSLDREKIVVGQTAKVLGAAEDVYGNPVEDGTAVVAGVSAGQVSNASTLDGTFVLEFTAPTKKQPVTLTVEVDQCGAKLDVPVVADVPAKVTVTPEKQKAVAGSSVKVKVLVEDQYGNAVEDDTKVTLAASGGTVNPAEAVTKDGVVEAQVTSGQAGEVAVKASTENGVTDSAAVSFMAVVPAGSQVKLDVAPSSVPGEYVVEGQVMKDGMPVPSVAVPLVAENGKLSDSMPVTSQQGEFSVTLQKEGTSSGCVTVAVDSSQAPGVTSGTVGIDPLVYGNQPWTDTGIDVGAGLLVRVSATGTWASELYAKVGDSGIPVKVGANGGFVTGVAGRLYLGPNVATYAGDVEAIFQVDDPAAVGILPTISLTANPTQLPADGKSTSALTGRVMYGQYPGVGVVVNLSATLGTVSPASPVTGADGSYQATFTAGTQGGIATVTALHRGLTQKLDITLIASTPGTIVLNNPEVIVDLSSESGVPYFDSLDAAENGVVAFSYTKRVPTGKGTFNMTPTVKVYNPTTGTVECIASQTYYNVNSCRVYTVKTNGRYVVYNDITTDNKYLVLYDVVSKTTKKVGYGQLITDFGINDDYLVFVDSSLTVSYNLATGATKSYLKATYFSMQPCGKKLVMEPSNAVGIYEADLETGYGWRMLIANGKGPLKFLNDNMLLYLEKTTNAMKVCDVTSGSISDYKGPGVLSESGNFVLARDFKSLYNIVTQRNYSLDVRGGYSTLRAKLTQKGIHTLNSTYGLKIIRYALDLSTIN